jgi:hypothetical protein
MNVATDVLIKAMSNIVMTHKAFTDATHIVLAFAEAGDQILAICRRRALVSPSLSMWKPIFCKGMGAASSAGI